LSCITKLNKTRHTAVNLEIPQYKHKTPCHTQPSYGSLDFVRDNPGEPVAEKTLTHSHLSWSSVTPYLLPPSIMIHGILPFHGILPQSDSQTLKRNE